MKESDWRYLVDVVLFICLGGMTLIGILMGLVIPAGPVASESSKYFLGLHRHQWGNIHAYLSIVFVILIIVLIILNWKSITVRTSQIFKKTAGPILVLTAVVPLIVLLVFWLFMPKDAVKYRGYGIETPERGRIQKPVMQKNPPTAQEAAGRPGQRAEDVSGIEPERRADAFEEGDYRAVDSLVITGRQTLLDIERTTGLRGRAIADRLGLPPTVSMTESLGRIRQRHGIETQTVREMVERMLKEESWHNSPEKGSFGGPGREMSNRG
ncbi:MAG: DUF4405 domain-containing protein [Candidatus Aminicenantes bacterium]|nr:DUF4405 domain-containing protein [Candidatus Aminicenantes bacterium]